MLECFSTEESAQHYTFFPEIQHKIPRSAYLLYDNVKANEHDWTCLKSHLPELHKHITERHAVKVAKHKSQRRTVCASAYHPTIQQK